MQRFSALETQTSVGVQTNLATRLLVHTVGVHQNVPLKVTRDDFDHEFNGKESGCPCYGITIAPRSSVNSSLLEIGNQPF